MNNQEKLTNASAGISKGKKFFKNCLGCGCVFIVVVVIIAIVTGILGYRNYKNWQKEESNFLSNMQMSGGVEVEEELDEKLGDFKESDIERESLYLSCDQLEILLRRVTEDNWESIGVTDVGVVCGDRMIDVYIKFWDSTWVVVKLWQRAEGEVDFVVYDVELGPYSLGGITFGYVSSEFSKGVEDAIDLLSEGDFSGRKIEEMYVQGDGVRFVGVK